MPRPLSRSTTLDNLKKEAKRWLSAIRAGDQAARERLRRTGQRALPRPVLRDVQHALALEYGAASWAALRATIAGRQTAAGAADGETSMLPSLLLAAGQGDTSAVIRILDAHPDIVNQRGTLIGHTGLRTALHFGVAHEAVIRALLDRGADPNIRDDGDNAFPLHFAAEREDLAVIALLVERGAQTVAGEVDDHELDIIGWAAVFGHGDRKVVDYLVAHGARHTIFSAVATGETDVIRALAAELRVNLDRPMDRANLRRRPLHLAVVKKQPAALATLLELGADVHATDAAGLTPLDQAALDGDAAMAQRLIDSGAAIELPAAIGLQRGDDIERLFREDPDCLRPGHRSDRLIVRAATQAAGHVIEMLIRYGASVHVREDTDASVDQATGYTPLHAAAFHGNTAAAAVLLQHGADPSVRDGKYCGTPAGWANYAGKHECRDLILEADIDLFEAIDRDRLDRIPAILERDPAALDRRFREYSTCGSRPEPEMTPLDWAVASNKDEAVRLLTARGARSARQDNVKSTP